MSTKGVRRELGLRPKPHWGSAPDTEGNGVSGRGPPAGAGAEPQRGLGRSPNSLRTPMSTSVWAVADQFQTTGDRRPGGRVVQVAVFWS